ANQLAHRLLSLGIRPDDRVAICVERGLDMVVGLLGILKAGGAYVPLDPEYPEARLLFMLTDCAPVALLTQEALRDLLPPIAVPLVVLEEDSLARQPSHNPDSHATGLAASHLAYVIYTSGSTGRPKGTLIQHDNVLRLFAATEESFGFGPHDTWTLFHSYAFDFSVWEIWGALLHGGKLVIVPTQVARSADQFYALLAREKVTILNQTPSAFRHLIEFDSPRTPLQLRTVIFGGEYLDRSTLTPWFETHGDEKPLLVNMYGITETTVHVTYSPLRKETTAPASVGRPIPGTAVYILDRELNPTPIGVAGELHVAGGGVARGYLNRPDLTTERFIPNPFSPSPDARMYRSGDLARYLPDGNVQYLGRIDNQVKIRGFRIELGEIEAQLLACRGVREAVAVVRQDRLVAYLVPKEGAELSVAELRAQLSSMLADFMMPSAYVTLASLPLTPSGKLDRSALPAPGADAYLKRCSETPTGEVESAIASIWQDLLQIQQVGRQDHFFELGGHSLLAVQLVSRLRNVLGVDIALRDLFAAPTLADFARHVAEAATLVLPPIRPVDRTQSLPLSWGQQRLWFLAQLDPAANVAYHVPAALRLRGLLDNAALTATLDRIITRHEILRTRFVKSPDGTATQVIAPAAAGFALSYHDLKSLGQNVQHAAVARLREAEFQRPFDFERGPLIRGALLQLDDEDHILLLCQHHIICDGWSIGILTREITTLYAAFTQELPDPLPPPGIQYADYAFWQRQWLKEEALRVQLDFWRNHLAGAPALLELPTDHPRPAVQSFAGASIPVLLPAELTAALRALSQRHGTTLFMTLLAAWSILLARLSGQNDLVIGTPVANRQRVEIEPL
ncbi:MAG TPA: amino acid adenylation domain-containing protein, partial [Steroidobacteraceae bacterium]